MHKVNLRKYFKRISIAFVSILSAISPLSVKARVPQQRAQSPVVRQRMPSPIRAKAAPNAPGRQAQPAQRGRAAVPPHARAAAPARAAPPARAAAPVRAAPAARAAVPARAAPPARAAVPARAAPPARAAAPVRAAPAARAAVPVRVAPAAQAAVPPRAAPAARAAAPVRVAPAARAASPARGAVAPRAAAQAPARAAPPARGAVAPRAAAQAPARAAPPARGAVAPRAVAQAPARAAPARAAVAPAAAAPPPARAAVPVRVAPAARAAVPARAAPRANARLNPQQVERERLAAVERERVATAERQRQAEQARLAAEQAKQAEIQRFLNTPFAATIPQTEASTRAALAGVLRRAVAGVAVPDAAALTTVRNALNIANQAARTAALATPEVTRALYTLGIGGTSRIIMKAAPPNPNLVDDESFYPSVTLGYGTAQAISQQYGWKMPVQVGVVHPYHPDDGAADPLNPTGLAGPCAPAFTLNIKLPYEYIADFLPEDLKRHLAGTPSERIDAGLIFEDNIWTGLAPTEPLRLRLASYVDPTAPHLHTAPYNKIIPVHAGVWLKNGEPQLQNQRAGTLVADPVNTHNGLAHTHPALVGTSGPTLALPHINSLESYLLFSLAKLDDNSRTGVGITCLWSQQDEPVIEDALKQVVLNGNNLATLATTLRDDTFKRRLSPSGQRVMDDLGHLFERR